jgi:hypothetical protein
MVCGIMVGCSQKITTEEALKQNAKVIEDLKKYEAQNTPKLELQSDHNIKIQGDYAYVTGSVKNTGNIDIQYFEVVCKFTDENGKVLDSDYTNSSLKLGKGETRKFEIMHKWDNRFKKYLLSTGTVR